MVKPKLTADKRKILGRKVKQLRRQGQLPATVYGKGIKSTSIAINTKTLRQIYNQAGETGIIDLTIKGEKTARSVLAHNLHRDPITGEPLHVELRQVDLTKKITVNIPLEIIGEAPAVNKGGVRVILMNEVEVEALPTDLVDKITVDISGLEEIGQSILVKDLKYDQKKMKLMIENLDSPIVKIEAPAKEEEPPPAETEAEVDKTETPAEGEPEKEAGEEKPPTESKTPAEAKEKEKPTQSNKEKKPSDKTNQPSG